MAAEKAATLRGQVLVVEDDAAARALLCRALIDAGAEVLDAGGREAALEVLRSDRPTDLMVISLKLDGDPGGGAALTRALKAAPATRGLPVLMIASRNQPADVLACLDAGCDDIVARPFFAPELLARVRAQLRARRLYDALSREKKDLDTVLEIHHALDREHDPETALEELVRIMARVLSVKRATIVLSSRDPRFGYAVASSDVPGLRGLEMDLRRYPEIARVMKTGKPLVVDDASESSLFAQLAPSLSAARIKSILAVPIVVEGEAVATLLLNTREARKKFTRREIRLCGVAAQTAGLVLRNARLFGATRGAKPRG